MKPSIYKVSKVGLGTLYVMPKPSSDWLENDIAYFQHLGINTILSLLEPNEEVELGLGDEKVLCRDKGIEFLSFPIKDRGLPELGPLKDMLPRLLERLNAGKNISIHCRGGIGRTGILSCCMLVEYGLHPTDAIDLVSRARQCGIPDTEEQKAFITQYYKTECGKEEQ